MDDVVLMRFIYKADAVNKHFQEQCSTLSVNLLTPVTIFPSPNFSFRGITIEDVALELQKLQSGKSIARDGVPNELLKLTSYQIAPQLAKIFNRSLSEFTFPSSWKDVILLSLLKEGKDPSQPAS